MYQVKATPYNNAYIKHTTVFIHPPYSEAEVSDLKDSKTNITCLISFKDNDSTI